MIDKDSINKIMIEADESEEVEDIYDTEGAFLLYRQKGEVRLFEFSSQHTRATSLSRTLVDHSFAFTSLQLLRAKTLVSNTLVFPSFLELWVKPCFPGELNEPVT